MVKIALIGSAPSSVALAPYDDASWSIWACSPGARPHAKRVNLWFEMHLWEPHQSWFSPEYVDFMAKLPCPVLMLEPVPAIPGSVPYPKNEIMEMYGPAAVYFYTSSLAWMMALAIAQNPEEIGLWGVDMSAAEEVYTHQRAGCQYWIGKARERGIRVTIPAQSDLAQPTPLYGYNEQQHQHQKLLARKAELVGRLNAARQTVNNATAEATYLQGAAEDVDYIIKTWVVDPKATEMLERLGIQQSSAAVPVPAPVAGDRMPVGDAVYADGMVAAPAPAPEPVAPPKPERRSIADVIAGVTGRAEIVAPTTLTWGSTPLPEFVDGVGA